MLHRSGVFVVVFVVTLTVQDDVADSLKRKSSSSGSTSRNVRPMPDDEYFARKYPVVTNESEHAKCQDAFEKKYEKYTELYKNINDICSRFTEFGRR